VLFESPVSSLTFGSRQTRFPMLVTPYLCQGYPNHSGMGFRVQGDFKDGQIHLTKSGQKDGVLMGYLIKRKY
jgi:hypothetical protein